MELITNNVSPGDWIIFTGHDPADLKTRMVKVGTAEPKPALYEGNRMMVRCPEIEERATIEVDGKRYGSLVAEARRQGGPGRNPGSGRPARDDPGSRAIPGRGRGRNDNR